MWFNPPHRKHLTGGSDAVLRDRPGGGGRDAKEPLPLVPPGQARAICPKRPQFLMSISKSLVRIKRNCMIRTTYIALLVSPLQSQTGAFGLDVSYTST